MKKFFVVFAGIPGDVYNKTTLYGNPILDETTKAARAKAGIALFVTIVYEFIAFALNMSQFFNVVTGILIGLAWGIVLLFMDRAFFHGMDIAEARNEKKLNFAFISRWTIILVIAWINSASFMAGVIFKNDLKKFYIEYAQEELTRMRAPLDSAAKHYSDKKIVIYYMRNVNKLEEQSIKLRDKTAYEISGDTTLGATGSEGDKGVAAGVRKEQEGATSAAAKARQEAEAELAATDEAKKYKELSVAFENAKNSMNGAKPGLAAQAEGLKRIRKEHFWEFLFWDIILIALGALGMLIKSLLSKNDSYVAYLAENLTESLRRKTEALSDADQIRNEAIRKAHQAYKDNVDEIDKLPAGPARDVARKAEDDKYLLVLSQIDNTKHKYPLRLRVKKFFGF